MAAFDLLLTDHLRSDGALGMSVARENPARGMSLLNTQGPASVRGGTEDKALSSFPYSCPNTASREMRQVIACASESAAFAQSPEAGARALNPRSSRR